MPKFFIEPFDFKRIFIDTLLGSSGLFVGLFIIVMSGVCGYYQMSNRIYGILVVISSLIAAIYLGEAVLFVILVVIGLMVFKIIGGITGRTN